MRQCYQRGYLKYVERKTGSACWEFLWRETDVYGKRLRRTAFLDTDSMGLRTKPPKIRFGRRDPWAKGLSICLQFLNCTL